MDARSRAEPTSQAFGITNTPRTVHVAEATHSSILDEGRWRRAFDAAMVGYGIGGASVGAQHRAHERIPAPEPTPDGGSATAPRGHRRRDGHHPEHLDAGRGGAAARRSARRDDAGPLPDVPSVVQADQTVAGAEIAPAPGADIVPMEGSVRRGSGSGLLDSGNQCLDRWLRVAEQHRRLLVAEERVRDAGEAGATAALEHDDVLRLVDVEDRHAGDR